MADVDHLVLDLGFDPFAPPDDTTPTWDELERQAAACTKCRLHESRTKVVFGDGDRDADLMLVGEAPGRQEDLLGRPFAGAAGNLLTNLLDEAGLARADVYVTNLVKCRPPENREPGLDEIQTCSPYLFGQLALVRPRVIVTLGAFATRLLLRRQVPVARVAGYRFDLNGATVIPTFHPSTALRGNPRAMTSLRRDLRAAKAVLDGRLATAAEALAHLRAKETGS